MRPPVRLGAVMALALVGVLAACNRDTGSAPGAGTTPAPSTTPPPAATTTPPATAMPPASAASR